MTVANLKVKITELGGSISDVIPSRKGKAVIKADLLSYIEDLVKKKNDVISAKKDDVVSEKSTKEISSTGSRSKKEPETIEKGFIINRIDKEKALIKKKDPETYNTEYLTIKEYIVTIISGSSKSKNSIPAIVDVLNRENLQMVFTHYFATYSKKEDIKIDQCIRNMLETVMTGNKVGIHKILYKNCEATPMTFRIMITECVRLQEILSV